MALDAAMPAAQLPLRSVHRETTKWPVTVIIRSAGHPDRAASFQRAIRSVLSQESVDVQCCVVFNGRAYDRDLVNWTRVQPATSCIVIHGGGKAEATLLGRQFVDTPYFCYLDDDDELLPYALAYRIAMMERGPAADCVATNGYHYRSEGDEPLFPQTERFVAGNFLESLVEPRNWLASGACMFRTQTVKEEYFNDLPPHREWTVIAYRIASNLRVKFADMPTCRINSSPVSESKKDTYAEASVQAWEKILHANRRDDLVPAIHKQQAAAFRNLCSYYRSKRRFSSAWRAYVRALKRGAGWAYVPYAALLLARTTKPAHEIKQLLQPVHRP